MLDPLLGCRITDISGARSGGIVAHQSHPTGDGWVFLTVDDPKDGRDTGARLGFVHLSVAALTDWRGEIRIIEGDTA
jgi:hypothetical protein